MGMPSCAIPCYWGSALLAPLPTPLLAPDTAVPCGARVWQNWGKKWVWGATEPHSGGDMAPTNPVFGGWFEAFGAPPYGEAWEREVIRRWR